MSDELTKLVNESLEAIAEAANDFIKRVGGSFRSASEKIKQHDENTYSLAEDFLTETRNDSLFIELEVGKSYCLRDGSTIKIDGLRRMGDGKSLFLADNNRVYLGNGLARLRPLDLIENAHEFDVMATVHVTQVPDRLTSTRLVLNGVYEDTKGNCIKICGQHFPKGHSLTDRAMFIGDNGSLYYDDGEGVVSVPSLDVVRERGLSSPPNLVKDVTGLPRKPNDTLTLQKGGLYLTESNTVVTIKAVRRPQGLVEPIYIGDNGRAYSECGFILPTKDVVTDNIVSEYSIPQVYGDPVPEYECEVVETKHRWMVISVSKVEDSKEPEPVEPKLSELDQEKYRRQYITIEGSPFSIYTLKGDPKASVTANGIVYSREVLSLKLDHVYLTKDGKFVRIIRWWDKLGGPQNAKFFDNLGNVYNAQGNRTDDKALNGNRNLVCEVKDD